MSKGWIKTHREIMEWEWFDDAEIFRFFQYLILKANYEEKSWKNIIIPKGSFLTGRLQLSRDLNRSERQIRTMLNKLKSTNEITIKSTNKYSIITICKYDIYQRGEDDERPAESPMSDQQKVQSATTTKEIKKEINKENNLSLSNRASDFFELVDEFKNAYVLGDNFKITLKALNLKEKQLLEILDKFIIQIKASNKFIELVDDHEKLYNELVSYFFNIASQSASNYKGKNVNKNQPVDFISDEDKQKYTQEQQNEFINFVNWYKTKYPNVAKMEQPIRINQYFKLITIYERDFIKELLNAMNNYKNLKNNVSAYDTFNNWAKRRPDEGKYINKDKNTKLGKDEYIDNNGNRRYGKSSIIIPKDAPPRPSEFHVWSNIQQNWVYMS